MRRFLTKVLAPVIVIEEEPLFEDEAVPKGYVDQLIDLRGLPSGGSIGQTLVKTGTANYQVGWGSSSDQRCLPFITTDGEENNISLIMGVVPFILSNGSASGINLSGCS